MTEEHYVDLETGLIGYRFVLINNCDYQEFVVDYDIAMSQSDWDTYAFSYRRTDSSGDIIEASQIEECRDDAESGLTWCRVRLGYFPDYKERGLAQPWQRRAGI